MIDPIVEEATAEHHAELDLLQSEARAALTDQRGGVRWLEEHPPHDWAHLAAGHDVFVARLDGAVMGYLVLEQVSDHVARVEQVYVTPGAREVGYGDELLAAAIGRARELGVRWFEGEALPGDRNTKNLYERAGITARSITVATRLSD